MKYKNEIEVKQALGIKTWRNLSKDKMIKFAAMMPDMDTEVALKVIEQFPAFTSFATDALNTMERAHTSTLSGNKESQDHFFEALKDIREVLKGELHNHDLTWEQRKYLIEQIQETGRMASEKDKENKQFLDGLLTKVLLGAGAAIALGVVFVGGKVMAESHDGSESSRDDSEGSPED